MKNTVKCRLEVVVEANSEVEAIDKIDKFVKALEPEVQVTKSSVWIDTKEA